MCSPAGLDETTAGVLARIEDGSLAWFERQVASVSACHRPVLMSFVKRTAAGVVVASSADNPDGHIFGRCNNRLRSKCEPCSWLYVGDQFNIARAGMIGGKGVPASVRDHPMVFVTLTAPSFGRVHGVREDGRPCSPVGAPKRGKGGAVCEHGIPTWCLSRHEPCDWCVAQPLCARCYDYEAAVLFNWHVAELWKRFQTVLPRQLARATGMSNPQLRRLVRPVFFKVYEFQARGVVHAHALVRLDAPGDRHDPREPWERPWEQPELAVPFEVLEGAIRATVARIRAVVPASADVERELRWGSQVDVQAVDGDPEKVAGYLAKYCAKAAGDDFGLGHTPLDSAHARRKGASAHMMSMIDEAHRLAVAVPASRGDDGQVVDEGYQRMPRFTHQLGFHSHIASKSRRFSTTMGRLRSERRVWQQRQQRELRGLPTDQPDDVDDEGEELIVEWTYKGSGWQSKGDAAIADSIAARTREGRAIRKAGEI